MWGGVDLQVQVIVLSTLHALIAVISAGMLISK